MAAAAVMVAVSDPTAEGSFFPGCTFHRMTGLWCPGCGLTRGAHQLLHGQFLTAFGSNLFTPFALLAIVLTWWAWVRRAFAMPPSRASVALITWRDRLPQRSGALLLTVVVIYGVARNIPASPFTALAP